MDANIHVIWMYGDSYHKYNKHDVRPLYFRSESIVHDCCAFHPIRNCNATEQIKNTFKSNVIPNNAINHKFDGIVWSYRSEQNRQKYLRSPLSCTALRWPANVVWRLNVLPHISHVACCPWRRTCVWKFSLMVNSL